MFPQGKPLATRGVHFLIGGGGNRTAPGGVNGVLFDLCRPVSGQPVDFGQVVLPFHGNRARFSFTGLPPEEEE